MRRSILVGRWRGILSLCTIGLVVSIITWLDIGPEGHGWIIWRRRAILLVAGCCTSVGVHRPRYRESRIILRWCTVLCVLLLIGVVHSYTTKSR